MKNTKILISPAAFCVNNDYVWIIDASIGVFYKYNRENGDNDVCRIKQDILSEQESQYLGIHAYNKKVFLVPCWEKDIIVVDELSMERRIIDEDNRKNGRFIKSFVIGKYLYCIPLYDDYFVKIDMETEKIKAKIEWKTIHPTVKYINQACMYNNVIYCVTPDVSDTIIKLENDTISNIKIDANGAVFTSIAFCSNAFYIYSLNQGLIYKYSEEFKRLECFESEIKDAVVLQNIKNKILLIENGKTGELIYINTEDGNRIKENSRKKSGTATYVNGLICTYDKYDYYYDRRNNVLYEIDDSLNKTEILPSVDRKKVKQIIGNRVTKECDFYSLEDFMYDL